MEVPPLPPPRDLHDYGLIGNLHTAALVSREGSVDWTCFPRFASPSLFARLLDAERGGAHVVRPREPFRSQQRYVPSSNILETRFLLSGRRAFLVTDFMPVLPRLPGEGLPTIVRRVRACGGRVSLTAVLEPAFDYARVRSRVERMPWGFRVRGARSYQLLSYRAPGRSTISGGKVLTTLELDPGECEHFVLEAGEIRAEMGEPEELLASTRRYWRSWVRRIPFALDPAHRAWHAWIERSLLALKLLSHADTGAFVAAPTTSLPEWPGGVRNWDYRYVWIRDAAFTAESFLNHGHPEEAEAFLRWVVARVRRAKGEPLKVVYGAHGETDLAEKELSHLSGFLGSKPVRIGNGAAEQFQLDIYGELLDAADMLARIDPGFISGLWPELSSLAAEVGELWRKPDRGIWEVRGPPAHYVHSKVMAWVALDRSARLAWRFSTEEEGDRWSEEAEKIRSEVMERGVDPRTGAFLQAYGREVPDASNLRIPMVGLLPFNDPHVRATIDQVRRELSDGPFVYRYRADDGIGGPEGAFLPCAFWLVEALARSGEGAAAQTAWEGLLPVGGSLHLMPEEYDPAAHRALGNYPQAFTHIGLLRAARALLESSATSSVARPAGPPPAAAHR